MDTSSLQLFKVYMSKKNLENLFGVKYLSPGTSKIVQSSDDDMYAYIAYHGQHASIIVERGDCVFIKDTSDTVRVLRGPVKLESLEFAVIVRGYAPPVKMTSLNSRMILPYVNGCSTRQLFPPERGGDPTMQLLTIPPHSSEQAHHIHSTVRVVYVLDGEGWSIVGTDDKHIRQKLTPGMTIVLDNMTPHHFETKSKKLLVMPVHIWSALPAGLESNHPMFNGTFMVNQGK
jgi:quercetin dioxygenase-like cupin family protein